MVLFIPLATGQSILKEVYASLASQTVDLNIVPCGTPGVINSNSNVIKPYFKQKKLRGEIQSRNLAISLLEILKISDEFVAFNDRDSIQLYPDNIERSINFLKKENWAGVSLPARDKPTEHIRFNSMIIKTEILKKIQFYYDRCLPMCLCNAFKSSIEQYGKFGYLPSEKKLIKEIV